MRAIFEQSNTVISQVENVGHNLFYPCLDLLIVLGVARDLLVERRVHKLSVCAAAIDHWPKPRRVHVAARSFLVAGDHARDCGMNTRNS